MSVKSFKTSGVGVDLAPKGLVLINTTSFSGVTSVSLAADSFTTTYTHYKIIFNLDSCTAGMIMTSRMRLAGTDANASQYQQMSTGANTSGTDLNIGQLNQTSWSISSFGNLAQSFSLEIANPKLAQYTSVNGFFAIDNNSVYAGRTLHLVHANATAYDSMSFIASTGNIAGSYSVYGFNK